MSSATSDLGFENPPIISPDGCGSALLQWKGGVGRIAIGVQVTTTQRNTINFNQDLSPSSHSFLFSDSTGAQDRPIIGTFTVTDDDGASIHVAGTFDSDCNFNVESASPPLSSSSSPTRTSQTSTQGTQSVVTSSTATRVTTADPTSSSVTTRMTTVDSTSTSVNTSATSQLGTQTQQSISSSEGTASSDSPTSSAGASGRLDHHLTAGIIIGIVIGVIAAVLLVILLAFCLFRRRRQRIELSRELSAVPWTGSPSEIIGPRVKSLADLLTTPHSLTAEPPNLKGAQSPGRTSSRIPPELVTRNSKSLPPLPPSPSSSAIPNSPQTSLPLYYPQHERSGTDPERDVVLHLQRQVDMLISENARLADQLPCPPAYRQISSEES